MADFSSVIDQIIILMILLAVSYIAAKAKFISPSDKDGVSNVMIKITQPALIITTLSGYNFSAQILIDSSLIVLFAIVSLIVSFAMGWLLSDKLNIPEERADVLRFELMFGNVVYLGYPVLSALMGDKGIFYGSVFTIANDTALWTLGLWLLTRRQNDRTNGWRNLFNMNTMAFFIGLVMFLTGIKLPRLAFAALNPLGKTTIYLSMIFIGAALAELDIKEAVTNGSTFVLSIAKLAVMPLLLYGLLTLLHVNDLVKLVVVVQVGMPASALGPALARRYGADYTYGAQCVLMSTLISLITLPALIWLLSI